MSNRREFTRPYWFNFNNMNVDEFYEDWIDEIVSMPLVSNSSILTEEVNNALQINQQLINNLYSLRRQLEIDSMDSMYSMDTMDTVEQIISGSLRSPNRRTNGRRFDLENNFVINNIGNADGVFDLFRSLLEVMIEPNVNTEMEDIKVTLTEADFNKLSHQTITECILKELEHKDCNVCIENYNVGDCVVTLPCKHYFHENCIRGWLCNEKITCPVCRHDTREHSEKKEINGGYAQKSGSAEDSIT